MAAVPDASALIALGKVEKVQFLTHLYGEVWITPWVWDAAVTKGKAMGARDAAYLERAVSELSLRRMEIGPKEQQHAARLVHQAGIGLGEAEVLAVAKERRATAILDDKGARAVAVGLGVVHIGTLGVVYSAYAKGMVTRRELMGLLEDLGRVLDRKSVV